MFAASALAIMIATPEEAMAACVPGAPVAGDVVNCAPGAYGPLLWAVDDLTVVVGSGVSASTVAGGASAGITMTGTAGDLNLSVLHSGSSVTSTNSDAINVSGWGTLVDLTIVSEGTASGAENGIDVRSWGSGEVSITANNVNGTYFTGIYAFTVYGTGLSVATTGTVTGGYSGIGTYNWGTGDIDIDAVDVSSTGANGIFARNLGGSTTDVAIDTTGSVYGVSVGINSDNLGSGHQTVNSVDVTGGSYNGIWLWNYGTNQSSTSTGTVTGGRDAINAYNFGSGTQTISANNASGFSGEGIFARNYGTSQTVTTTGLVTGTTVGVDATNFGSGSTTITVDDVSGGSGEGIHAYGDASTTDMTVTTNGTVYGKTDGIWACSQGSGTTTVTTYGTVTGDTGRGIYACSTIVTNAGVYGATDGIVSNHIDTDGISITSNDVVYGYTGAGIAATNSASGTYVTIDANDYVYGGASGIFVDNFGTGATTIDATDVTGGTNGINAAAYGTGFSVTATGTVAGGSRGIWAYNHGDGALSISVDAVSGTTLRGIEARNFGTATDMTVDATGTVYGGTDGIRARNYGTGDTTINVVDVTGATGDGVFASNGATAGNLSVNSTDYVHGGTNGIFVTNSGSGETLVTAAANVTGDTTFGIYARGAGTGSEYVAAHGLEDEYGNPVLAVIGQDTDITYGAQLLGYGGVPLVDSYGDPIYEIVSVTVTPIYGGQIIVPAYTRYSSVTIDADTTVTGGTTGIWGRNDGAGNLTISSVDVYGTSSYGIYGVNFGAELNISSTNYVYGGQTGIFAINHGNGGTSVTSADVVGGAARGMYVYGGASSEDMLVASSSSVTGQTDGIYVRNLGVGATIVSGTDVTGTTGQGIHAYGDASTVDMLVVSDGTVYGKTDGIWVDTRGVGSTIVTAHDVVGDTGRGIYAHNASTSTDMLIVSDGTATGFTDGVYASSNGTGSLIVSVVDAEGETEQGIEALGSANGTDILVAASGTVTGYVDGIRAINLGTGGTFATAFDVTGTTGEGMHVYGTGTTILDGYGNTVDPAVIAVSTGTVTSYSTGIYLRNEGLGSSLVSAVNVHSSNGRGIYARSAASTSGLTVATSGVIYGYTDGIWACGTGSDGTLIQTTGTVTGQTGDGIYACSTIQAQAYVYGGVNGINVNHLGVDGVTITAVDVTGGTGNGINVYNPGTATYVRITDTATVTGGTHGIQVDNLGTEEVKIITQNTYGNGGSALQVISHGTYVDITTNGVTTGFDDGIYVHSYGSGAVTIDSIGATTGTNSSGIFVNAASGTDVDITATGDVTGGTFGVRADNYGSGRLDVDVNNVSGGNMGVRTFASGGTDTLVQATGYVYGGTHGVASINLGSGYVIQEVVGVTGQTGSGVYANTAGTYIDITATGTVYGGHTGISTRNTGSGTTTINAIDVTGANISGIYSYSSGTDITINVTGTLYGGTYGLVTRHNGSGSTTVNVVDATGSLGTGIRTYSDASTTGTTIVATDSVYGGTNGILARSYGTGTMDIDVVDVTGNTSYGIYTFSSGTGVYLTATDTVYGGTTGVEMLHNGTYSVDVDLIDVTGGSGIGVRITNSAAGENVDLDITGTTYGGTTGIFVSNNGTGSTTINAVDITGQGAYGIYARNAATTTDLRVITTGTVYGGTDGINACGIGSGGTYIHAYGTVTGGTGDGIYACSTIIAEMAVYGGTNGINVNHLGVDGVNITTNSTVTGNTGVGIQVANPGTATFVDIDANDTVYGGMFGMNVTNSGTGSVDINAIDIGGGSHDGIYVGSFGAGPDVNITTTGTVLGGRSGIAVNSASPGEVNINAVNAYGTTTGTGIAVANHFGTNTNITATGHVYGNSEGVYVRNTGTGSTTINVVTASGYTNNGIFVYQDASADAVSVTATGYVYGKTNGIDVRNYGTGHTGVYVGDVHGDTSRGMYVRGYGTGTTITSTGTVYGLTAGIAARHTGTGLLDINAEHAYSNAGPGIHAVGSGSDVDIDIDVSSIASGAHGIFVTNGTAGTTDITSQDTYGNAGIGIGIYAYTSGSDLNITANGYTYGQSSGILSVHSGTGATTINTSQVQANTGTGIMAISSADAVSVTATSNVSGGNIGIYVLHSGTGSVDVNATSASGPTAGIQVYNGATGDDVSITATGSVTSAAVGINVFDFGSGGTYINPGANTYGGNYGIRSISVDGTTIVVANGEVVESPGTAAIFTGDSTGTPAGDTITTEGIILGHIYTTDGNDVLNFDAGSITGTVYMGNNDDTVNWVDGSITGQFLGGADYDTFNVYLAGGGAWMPTGTGADLIDEFEELNFFTGGWTVAGGNQLGYDLIQFHTGTNWFSGALVAGELGNLNGSSLIVADGSSVSGNLFNGGSLDIGEYAVASMDVGGDFTQNSFGTFHADVFGPGNADLLTVAGAVTVDGALVVDQSPAPFEGVTTLIDGGTALSGTFASVSGIIPGGLLFSQTIEYDAVDYDVNLVSTVNSGNSLGLNENQGNVVDGVVNILFDPDVTPDMFNFALAVISLTDADDVADVADELYPGIMDAAVAMTDGGLRRFNREILGEARGQGAGGFSMEDERGHTWWAHSSSAAESMAANKHVFTNYETHALDLSFGVDGFNLGAASFGAALGYSGAVGSTSTGRSDEAKVMMGMAGIYARLPVDIAGTGLHGRFDGSFAYGTASGTMERRVEADAIGLDEFNRNDYRANGIIGEVRFNIDGRNGDTWLIRPVALIGGTATNMRNDNVPGNANVSALHVDGSSHQRGYVGAGLELYQQWDDNKWMMLRSTGMGYFGDNQNIFHSQFANATPGTTMFETLGAPLNSVVLFEGGFGYTFGGMLFMGLEGFAEVGDRESMGGGMHVSATF